MMGRISRAWKLIKTSWRVLKLDRELLLFPPISMVISGILIPSFVIPVIFFSGITISPEVFSGFRFYIFLFSLYIPLYFVGNFFNTAVVGCADMRMKGENPSFTDGIEIASNNWKRLLGWSILASTVGVALQILYNKAGFIGRLVTSFIGIAWTYGTFFIVPVLIFQENSILGSVKESAGLFKDTWGERLTGSLGFGIIFMVLGILGVLPLVFLTLSGVIVLIIAIAAGVLYFALLFTIYSALQGIFVTALYHYAVDGELPGPFGEEMLPSGVEKTSSFKDSGSFGGGGGAFDNLSGSGKI